MKNITEERIKMAKLKVYVKNNQTEVKVPVGIRLLIRRCCQAVLTTEGYKENAEVSVSFVSNSEIRKINAIAIRTALQTFFHSRFQQTVKQKLIRKRVLLCSEMLLSLLKQQ